MDTLGGEGSSLKNVAFKVIWDILETERICSAGSKAFSFSLEPFSGDGQESEHKVTNFDSCRNDKAVMLCLFTLH